MAFMDKQSCHPSGATVDILVGTPCRKIDFIIMDSNNFSQEKQQQAIDTSHLSFQTSPNSKTPDASDINKMAASQSINLVTIGVFVFLI